MDNNHARTIEVQLVQATEVETVLPLAPAIAVAIEVDHLVPVPATRAVLSAAVRAAGTPVRHVPAAREVAPAWELGVVGDHAVVADAGGN